MSRAWRLFGALSMLVVLGTGTALWLSDAPSLRSPTPPSFDGWQRDHAVEVDKYRSFLRRHGVADVLAMEDLLRLGRRWKTCGAGEFSVPPADTWRAMVPTLQLLAELQTSGSLDGFRIASSYRPGDYNRCEGGSTASRHLSNQALDLDLKPSSTTSVDTLCAAWRRMGPRRRWGLGFYSASQIHLDTAGFRTWGTDFHAKTSMCMRRN